MEMTKRPRRLRGSMTLRKMVRETRMDKASLMYPMFVMDGENKVEEIPSMERTVPLYRWTVWASVFRNFWMQELLQLCCLEFRQ